MCGIIQVNTQHICFYWHLLAQYLLIYFHKCRTSHVLFFIIYKLRSAVINFNKGFWIPLEGTIVTAA